MASVKRAVNTRVELRFTVGKVRKVLEHAKRCAEHLPMQEGEPDRGPGIVLVGEASIYLASNGMDNSPLDDGERLVWAQGMDPSAWEDEFDMLKKKRELVGENDDAVFLAADDVSMVLENAKDWDLFRILVLHDGKQMHKVLMMPCCTRLESRNWTTGVLSAPRAANDS